MADEALHRLYDRLADAKEPWQPLDFHPDGWSTTRYDDVVRLLRGERGDLLDVGIGSALLLLHLAGQFDRISGIDLSPIHVERARGIAARFFPDVVPRLDLRAADADQPFPFAEGRFDVVTAIAVLEHVVDPFRFVDDVARVLKPGGCAVITVPNAAYLRHVGALLMGRVPLTGIRARDMRLWRDEGWDGGHLHYFTKGALKELLASAGLVAEEWTGDGKWARVRRVLPNLVGNLTVRARKVDNGG